MVSRTRARVVPVCPRLAAAAGACLALAHTASADEDWRKLLDRRPPYAGPIIQGEVIRPDGNGSLRGVFAAQGINLLSWIPLNQFPGGAGQGSAADIWGYVSPSGREYAIIGLEDGTAFVEVTNPTAPVIVGYVPGPESLWHDNIVVGHYAYLVSEGGSGIQVVNLANIDAGEVQFVQNRLQAGHTSTHTIVANPDTGYLYLCGTNINNGGLTAVSTADPANPTIVGAWTDRYVHEAQVISYTEGPYAGREIAFCFTGGPALGYTSSGGLDIVDVTDKNNMHTIGQCRYEGLRFCHQGWVSEDRRFLYVNDELDEPSTRPTTTTYIINIEDLTNPTVVGTFTNGLPAVDHNLYVKGDLIFAGNYRSGLRIYSARDPVNLMEVAWIDTFPENDGSGFNGVWGNYPYFPSGTVVISDIENGLIVVQPDINFIGMTFPSGRPEFMAPRRPGELFVQTAVFGAPLDASTIRIVARVNGGPWEERPMLPTGEPGLFRGTLPPAACFSNIEYYLTADNQNGATFRSPANPSEVYTALVASGTAVTFADDMEIDRGWTVGDPSNPDTATSGRWNRGDPEPTIAQPGDDHTPDPGVICWVTGSAAGGSDGANDVDNGKTTLMSPVLDLSATPHARIGYWRWYSNSAGGAPNADTFEVAISNNNGATWVPVETVGPAGPQTSGGWYYHEFRVADLVAPTSAVKLRFVASDLRSGSLVEAAIDDFVVYAPVCAPVCVADRDGNTVVNSADISAYLTDWLADLNTGTFFADFDGLGGTNSADISAFLSAWLAELTAGCH